MTGIVHVLVLFFAFPSFIVGSILRNPEGNTILPQACLDYCPTVSQVPCNTPVLSPCFQSGISENNLCEGLYGTGLNTQECLVNVVVALKRDNSETPCRTPITDNCGNPCSINTALTGCNWCATNFDSCSLALAEGKGEGYYLIRGNMLYCDSDGFGLIFRLKSDLSATSLFSPSVDFGAAQIPSASNSEVDTLHLSPAEALSSDHYADESLEGHVNMSIVPPSPRLKFQCRILSSRAYSSFETDVFSGFTPQTYGVYGSGEWGVVADANTYWRHSHGACGLMENAEPKVFGIGLCSGPGVGSSYANHLASFWRSTNSGIRLGCAGEGSEEDGDFLLWAKW